MGCFYVALGGGVWFFLGAMIGLKLVDGFGVLKNGEKFIGGGSNLGLVEKHIQYTLQ